MDGNAYLQRLVEQLLHPDPPTTAGAPLTVPEISGVAHGLVAAGALAPEDARRILDSLYAEIRAHGQRTTRRLSASSSVQPPTGYATSHQDPRTTVATASPQPLHVASLIGHSITVGTTEYVLVSIELWSTSFTVRYAVLGPPPEPGPRPTWSATDEAGTLYRPAEGGSHGNGQYVSGEQRFHPALTRPARHLHLAIHLNDATAHTDVALPPRPS